ncbi:hypothetical protein Kpol_1010p14 [Vanderwaltozyma polyspora DSM 70294]|uniref:Uncharacterized protein n=1 Tax=Vanderwaltozyma polyspora (strain ATCC 22028 / DSM 70294 / BCRC 21397 / CBS 2163 / NBRC 10782 / NRRL Y-8283 / UCD 57-17) TaxID=436907 RepID=A7TIG1_VANPO|nr:uncharacterized protein Kpol_1010p14 [Vanderwaltozyma polyspora DSM 70294]EDO17899.1 hypothetical protein Kpol_1010p14 [Vanderwaltozyma polyspora DSM 70294]
MFSQGSIPEVKEDGIGFALNERKSKIPQFQDLGPPDLITLVKYIPSQSQLNGTNQPETVPVTNQDTNINMIQDLYHPDKNKGEIGTYFYSIGIDTSDPTSIAVFLKNIADTISEEPQAWFGKNKNFHVSRITLSTWNTFRKCDVNVVVHIPGTLQTYILDINGDQLQVNPVSTSNSTSSQQVDERLLIWAEVFFSGIVRSAMLMKDNGEEGEVQNLVETLVLNPLTSGEIDNVANTFIKLFPLVYERGPILGAPVNITNVTRSNNYLIETLIEVVKLTHSLEECKTMLEHLIQEYPEAVVVLIRVLFACEQEVDAIKLANEQLKLQEEAETKNDEETIFPLDYKVDILCAQVEFLLDCKHDYSLAQQVAEGIVSCSPSEFKPWYLLAKSFVRLNDVENALLTLNACPMSPLKEKYTLKRVVPIQNDANLHLPLPVDVILDEVSSLNPQDIQREHKSADPVLANLAAANLKSTFQLVYKLLTEIVQITGWESLLKYRSNIFVMEEEYQSSAEDDKTSESQASREGSTSSLRTKRLCERWLDNLFMLLYEDLKTYTLWQTEQLYFEAQNTKYNKLTIEWELFGLCARRLGHYPEAARAFQIGLSQRFSAGCARRLLEYCVKENVKIKYASNSSHADMSSNDVIDRLRDLDNTIIDLCVKICCWNHRWYIEFSIKLIEALSLVIQDMGLTKVTNEISARYPESVSQLMKDNLLDFFANDTNEYYDA